MADVLALSNGMCPNKEPDTEMMAEIGRNREK
jgi:hypothetical protein